MKIKWKVVSPYTGIEEDAPANNASSGDVAMPPDAVKKKKKHTLIDRNGKIDGRTKAYREHRKKLENARQKRNNARSSRFIENIKKKATEVTSGQGYTTAKPMADMSNRNMPKKKKK
tara:strand:+ start:24 stop:374 length:351 start_codon:yes stop_codon:yes gene_type:complete